MKKHRNTFQIGDHRETRGDDGRPKIEGYSVLWNSRSVNLGGFFEEFLPNAFQRSLSQMRTNEGRVISTLEHMNAFLLGATDSGTLFLAEDSEGLFSRTFYPDTQTVRDLVVSPLRRRDLRHQSFSFSPPRDGAGNINPAWAELKLIDGKNVRQVREANLHEIAYVADPAYRQTSAELRSLVEGQGQDFDAFQSALFRAHHRDQLPLLEEDLQALRRAIELLQDCLPSRDGQESAGENNGAPELLAARNLQQRLTVLRHQLNL